MVNDYHFWAVVESRLPSLGCTPRARDKGEHVPFQSDGGPVAREYSLAEIEEDDQDHHSSWALPPGLRTSAESDKELQFCAVLSRW